MTTQREFAGPWFNSETAARYTDKPSREAFRVWAMRKGIVAAGKGGRLLYAKADIDRELSKERQPHLVTRAS